LGGRKDTIKLIFKSKQVLLQEQKAIKAVLKEWAQNSITPAQQGWVIYLDEDLTKYQQAVRKARKPTFDYLRKNKPAGTTVVVWRGCDIWMLKSTENGNAKWTQYQGPWYGSVLGTSPCPEHPLVSLGKM
jgi:hypothetical protein